LFQAVYNCAAILFSHSRNLIYCSQWPATSHRADVQFTRMCNGW